MKVRFSIGMGILLLLCGLFCLGAGLLIGKGTTIFIGALNIGIGLGMMTQPMFVVNEHTVELKNLLGMTLKTLSIDGLHVLSLNNKKLSVPTPKGPKKIGGFFARANDIQLLAEAIERAKTAAANTES